MLKKWNWRLKATAIAAITAGGMLLGGPVTAMAAPDDTTDSVEETQDASAQEEGTTEAAKATDEGGSDTSDEVTEDSEETNNEIAVQIEALNDALDQLRERNDKPRRKIGYTQND